MSLLFAPVLWCLASFLMSGVADAQTYRAMLGDRVLGTIEYTSSGQSPNQSERMFANLDNTPLGVADGTFEAISRPASDGDARVRQYTGVSKSARDSRSILVTHSGGMVRRTEVIPDIERTAISDPAKVPRGIIDLAQAFGRFTRSSGCPAPFRFYDGRRVIDVRTVTVEAGKPNLICNVEYRVIAGPGHLSPFRFTRLTLDLQYDGGGVLAGATVRAGLFSLKLER